MEWPAADASAGVRDTAWALSPTKRKLTYNAGLGIVGSAGIYTPSLRDNDDDALQSDLLDLRANRQVKRRVGMLSGKAESLAQNMVDQRALQTENEKALHSISVLKAQLESDAYELNKNREHQLQASRDFVAAQARESRLAHDGYMQGRRDGEVRARRLYESQQRAARAHDDAAALRRSKSESRNTLRLQHAQRKCHCQNGHSGIYTIT